MRGPALHRPTWRRKLGFEAGIGHRSRLCQDACLVLSCISHPLSLERNPTYASPQRARVEIMSSSTHLHITGSVHFSPKPLALISQHQHCPAVATCLLGDKQTPHRALPLGECGQISAGTASRSYLTALHAVSSILALAEPAGDSS